MKEKKPLFSRILSMFRKGDPAKRQEGREKAAGAAPKEKSSYELYLESHPEYAGTEGQWANDFMGGMLGVKPKCTVSFDADGGSDIPSQTVEEGGKASEPEDPAKEGYAFQGWYLGDAEWPFDGAVTESVTLTARWRAIPYAIAYHPDGLAGIGGNPSAYTVEDRFAFRSPLIPAITEEGGVFYKNHAFGGWYLDSGFAKRISGIVPGMTGNIDVYAKINNGTSGTKLEDYLDLGGRFEDCEEGSYHVYGNARYIGTDDNPYLVLVKAASISVASVTIHENCRFVCTEAFDGCNRLAYNLYGKAKYLGNANNPYLALVKAASTSVASVTIHENCRFICSYAFSDCANITKITIPNSVKSIGHDAFSDCANLTKITIPEGITSIGSCAFYGCTNITKITIPNSVKSIGEYAFYNCTNITKITIPEGVTCIGDYAFDGCNRLAYNLYGNAKYLGNANNPYLALVKAASTSVDSVTIHENCRFVCSGAFDDCNRLTSITIPDGVTSIGDDAFENCTGLTSITIPEGVTSISYGAFKDCTGLTSITIPNSVTSIEEDAFYNCTGLTSITIPEGVTSISYGAFKDCAGLTSITIPNNVTYIDFDAFKGCTGLTSITIPECVTCIGGDAFKGCTCLTSVFYKGTQEEWDDISIDSSNEDLADAICYYYSEDDPSIAEGMDPSLYYWHYVNGVPTPWGD